MSAPCVAILIDLEARPRVVKSCEHESDQIRLEDWINAHPELVELVGMAIELANKERAA